MKTSPIFIHSLFRAGSTYLFKVFRRSKLGYWCYQEPLHEIAVFSRENPLVLQKDHGEEKAQLLRHAEVDGAYFKELQEIWPAWKDVITEPIIYDAYFLGENEEIGIPYWQVLVEAARGRPVFQECRTSGRIGAIKNRMGGHHIYLWRNPWDQWWSYKVTSYFDAANQLILHAHHAPQSVQHVLEALHLPAYEGRDLAGAFAFYGARPLTSEQSYLVFYLLWCLALHEGAQHANMLLNIDRLSDSLNYREEMLARLKDADINGIDFSDCRVPQGRYLEKDQGFFTPLENRVHLWLIEGGWVHEGLDKIQMLRRQYAPASWNKPITALASADLAEQASRARMLTCRFEENAANAEAQAQQAEGKAQRAEAQAQQADSRAQQAEGKAQRAEGKAQRAESRANEFEQRAQQAESRANEFEQRAQQAESRANEFEQRAQQAEWRAQQGEARAVATEAKQHELKAQVDQLNGHAHHWWLQATQLEAERDALRRSSSWRITAPLRWSAELAIGSCTGLRRSANRLAHATTHIFQRFLAAMMRVVLHRPALSHRIKRRLMRHPELYHRLLDLARRNGTIPTVQPYVASLQTATEDAHPELPNLTPRAREIYSDLKTAIERRQREQP